MNPLRPDWPAPPNIHACSTTRQGGASRPPFDSLNLAAHVEDEFAAVQVNRGRLREFLQLPGEPYWLNQVHGVRIVNAAAGENNRDADGSFSTDAGTVCAVMTADCLPLLLCDRRGSRIAAAHAGWRGLCSGVLEAAVEALDTPGEELLAWMGPAIGPQAFEVDDRVRDQFIDHDPRAADAFFATRPGHWLADLYRLARQRLGAHGVDAVYGGGLCTYSEADRFYSYRREKRTGRMATLIWMD